MSNGPDFVVYTVIDTPGNGKNFWQRVGSAWKNKDDSINVRLNALPVNGTLHIRVPKPQDDES